MLDRFYATPARKGFHWPGRLISGPGCRSEARRLCAEAATLVVSDAALIALAADLAPGSPLLTVSSEPGQADIAHARSALADRRVDLVLAVGGGSTMDVAKTVALGLRHDWAAPKDMPRGGLPPRLIAVPTLAGSGAETSRFALLSDARGLKQATRSWDAVPDLTVIDPELVMTAGPTRLLWGAFDAFMHLWETLVCRHESGPETAMIALAHIPPLLAAAERIMSAGRVETDDAQSLALASAWGGIAISNVRTGAVHTLAESLAAQVPLPHPLSLAVFAHPVIDSYAGAIAARLAPLDRAVGAPAWARAAGLWDRMLDDTGARTRLAAALAAHPVDRAALAAATARDTVLAKEHPVPLAPGALDALAARALEAASQASPRSRRLSAH